VRTNQTRSWPRLVCIGMTVRLVQGRTEPEGATVPIGRPFALTNGQLAAYTHSSLKLSTDARISPVGLTVRCTVSFT
jgi:hypothetical protein